MKNTTRENLVLAIETVLKETSERNEITNPSDYICTEEVVDGWDEEVETANDLAQSIFDEIEESGYKNQESEVVYYCTAMKILTEHDCSLKRSMRKAGEMEYNPANLSSETLAGLLMEEIIEGALSELIDDIETAIDDIVEQAKEEADEENEEEEEA